MIEEVLKVSFFPDRGADRRRRHRDRTTELPCLGCPGVCDSFEERKDVKGKDDFDLSD